MPCKMENDTKPLRVYPHKLNRAHTTKHPRPPSKPNCRLQLSKTTVKQNPNNTLNIRNNPTSRIELKPRKPSITPSIPKP